MALRARLRSFWRNVLHRSDMERDMSDELQFHLAAPRRGPDCAPRPLPGTKPCGSRGSSSVAWRNTRKRLGRVSD